MIWYGFYSWMTFQTPTPGEQWVCLCAIGMGAIYMTLAMTITTIHEWVQTITTTTMHRCHLHGTRSKRPSLWFTGAIYMAHACPCYWLVHVPLNIYKYIYILSRDKNKDGDSMEKNRLLYEFNAQDVCMYVYKNSLCIQKCEHRAVFYLFLFTLSHLPTSCLFHFSKFIIPLSHYCQPLLSKLATYNWLIPLLPLSLPCTTSSH